MVPTPTPPSRPLLTPAQHVLGQDFGQHSAPPASALGSVGPSPSTGTALSLVLSKSPSQLPGLAGHPGLCRDPPLPKLKAQRIHLVMVIPLTVECQGDLKTKMPGFET